MSENFDPNLGYRYTVTKEVVTEVWAWDEHDALVAASQQNLNQGTIIETRLTDEHEMEIIRLESKRTRTQRILT